ncbi:hypothetical protein, partial [Mycobacterium tuberculosis]
VYLLEVRNLERNAAELYYAKPGLSFFKMVIDYFFLDYFSQNILKLNDQQEIERKYQEDATQFLRRLSRLFFGKMQYILQQHEDAAPSWKNEKLNEQRNEYYINDLLEKIDDISSIAYERASPFGCILFLNQKTIIGESSPVKFAIRFMEEDRINLEDSKRIRKLLELTNMDKHLYLIADHQW